MSTNTPPTTSTTTPVTRNSPRSINLPTLVVHSPVHREHKRRNSEPASPTTPKTPQHSTYFTGFPSYTPDPWNLRLASRKSPLPQQQHLRSSPLSPHSRLASPLSRTSSTTAVSSSHLPLPLSSDSDEEDSETLIEEEIEYDTGFIGNSLYLRNTTTNTASMSNPGATMKRKVVIMGSPSVGKTSLTQQYVAPPTYNASYYPTIEDTSHKTVTYNGVQYECEIIDSAGLEEYSLFPGKYGIGVHGYILVYAITSRQSFDMVPIVHDKILDYAGLEKVPCVLVGQKLDLQSERAVSTAEGEALAKKLNAGFIESSAKDNKNVSKAFDVLLAEMQKEYNPAPEKKKASWWSWGAK
ncbi:hypothetical protein I302_104964 [Kwoniella bestiolae CBS 10118]|uniref:Ras family, other n=1 Tax=Kwoniella bestiolae CBS 10118 TaxID=1296100 RepID=A0A1B9FRB7_9TREE|nr:Ras family, other [Kwoniella bestiolae CBS 10118]OCF21292.1 Ras family, other [Kwoniella bestiolae CBS 10118]